MKRIAIIFLSISPFAVAAQRKAALQLQQKITGVVAEVSPACVRLWGFDTVQNQRNSAQFSGVMVKGGYILTAAHVVVPGTTYRVMFTSGKSGIAVALGKIEFLEDKTRPDVALMKMVTKGDWPFANMSTSQNLKPFEPSISIAYPESLNQSQPTIRFGYVTEPLNERGFIKSTCMMEPGDSGGPLFDSNGYIIGLHSAIEVPEKDNYDVPIDLYRKYWSALMLPKVYHALPEEEDSFEGAGSKVKMPIIPDLSDMAKFIGIGNAFQKHCVTIKSKVNQQWQTIVGTLISVDWLSHGNQSGTLVVSKSSMVGDSATIIINKSLLEAAVIARDKATDLVVLRLPKTMNEGINLSKIKSDPMDTLPPGSFLISAQPDTNMVISVLGNKSIDLPKVSSAGFLGATAAHNSIPAKIYFVRPGSPAALNGIKAGETVVKVQNRNIGSEADYNDAMEALWPGDTLRIQIKSADLIIKRNIVLTYPPEMKYNHPVEFFAGGKSQRRDGFKDVRVHDAILKPYQCGGPVFDIQGNFIGINIARFSRANSLILKVQYIKAVLAANRL